MTRRRKNAKFTRFTFIWWWSKFSKTKRRKYQWTYKGSVHIEVLSDGQVGRDFIEENWVEFLDFQEDVQKCKDCMGLYQCHKVSKGMKQAVHVENHHLKTILVPCKYGKEILEKQNILSHITVSNVSDDLLLSDLKSIKDIMNKELASTIDHFFIEYVKKRFIYLWAIWLWKINISWFFNKITC